MTLMVPGRAPAAAARGRPAPGRGGHGTEHRRTKCHFHLDDGFHAADPAQDDPAAAAGGHVSRSPAGHVLAANRLPRRGECSEVRGGLGAVAAADRTDQPEHCGQRRDQGGDGDRRPDGGRAMVNRIGRARPPWRRATWTCHGPPPSSTWLRPRRAPAGTPPPRARLLVRAPRLLGRRRGRAAAGPVRRSPLRPPRRRAPSARCGHRRCQACREARPRSGSPRAASRTSSRAASVHAHRRRSGADRAEGERGDQGQAAQGERGLDGDRPAVGPTAPRRRAPGGDPSEPGRERPLHELGEGGRDRVAGDDAVSRAAKPAAATQPMAYSTVDIPASSRSRRASRPQEPGTRLRRRVGAGIAAAARPEADPRCDGASVEGPVDASARQGGQGHGFLLVGMRSTTVGLVTIAEAPLRRGRSRPVRRRARGRPEGSTGRAGR